MATGGQDGGQGSHPGPAGTLALIRTVLFYLHIGLATVVLGLWGLLPVLIRRSYVHRLARVWAGYIVTCARWHLGLTCEIRGTPPDGPCIIAAKHQSFWDILVLTHSLPRPAFIMKREVMRVPIMGAYARAAGCIPIDRNRGAAAMTRINAEVRAAMARPEGLGQLIIYPEGTRVPPGESRRYKHGVAGLAEVTGLPVVPVAVNAGLFWPKRGIPIRSGRSVVEYLPPLTDRLVGAGLLAELRQQIEGTSTRLMAEAGFSVAQAEAGSAGALPGDAEHNDAAP